MLPGLINAHHHSNGTPNSLLGVYNSFLVHGMGQDAAFLASLPASLRQQVQSLTPPQQELSSVAYLEIISDAVRNFNLIDDEDMFTEMRLAARLHRTPQIQAPAPTFKHIFHLVTTGGAKLLRREQSLGNLTR